MAGINTTLVVVWLMMNMVTARTRFSTEERPGRTLRYAMLWWACTLVMLGSVVGTRIYSRWTL